MRHAHPLHRLKIAMVSEHASPLACIGGEDAGGQNVHVAALATALADRGHEVVVYTRADRPGLPRRVSFAPGVEVEHVVAGPEIEIGKDQLLAHMGAFAQQLARSWWLDRPDVVHAHFWMSGKASMEAASEIGLPVVQTFHALGVVKQRWQGNADTSPPERVQIERHLAESADRVVATCADEVRELRTMGAVGTDIDIVPCGVDTTLFTPPAPNERRITGSRGPFRLIVLGRLVPRKGIQDAIRALVDLPDSELLIVGGPAAEELVNDPEAVRLRQIAEMCGVADRVRLTGRVAHEDLPPLIRSCDLMLAVPIYEPFGIAPIEAMACGVPVVGTAVGGLLDTVVDGVTGTLVPAGDPLAIARAARALLFDPVVRRAMGRAGVSRVRERYSWERVAQETERSYLGVLAGRTASASAVEVSR